MNNDNDILRNENYNYMTKLEAIRHDGLKYNDLATLLLDNLKEL